jgi:DNA repair protein RecN (Recombination protein N)
MLKFLKIKDFALFEEVSLEGESGLLSITGETGSGKSLLLDALCSILGGKCNTLNIRSGQKKYQIEAIFSLNESAKTYLEEKGIDYENDEIYLKKELFSDGKSRVQIGSSLAPSSFLRELGVHLSEIHRQNEQYFLLERSTQLDYLDQFASLYPIRKEFSERFKTYQTLKKRVEEMSLSSDEKKKRVELLRYQIQEIQSARLLEGEEEQLIKDEKLLLHGEKAMENYSLISELLAEAESSVLSSLSKILNSSDRIASIHPEFESSRQEFYQVYDKLKDLSHQVLDEKDEIFFSEERLSLVQDRLDTYSKLKKKYGADFFEIQSFLKKAEMELDSLIHSEEEIHSLEEKLESARKKMTELAVQLSNLRRESIIQLESKLGREFEELGLKGAKLQIVMRWEQALEGELSEGDKKYLVTDKGLDQIDFYFNANPGEKPKPLRKIISGGEMSRVTLAIKSILGNKKLLVFDEIDSGVGGETAFLLADKLKKISRTSQVILITHSQQIAALSDLHFVVEKENSNNRTVSKVRLITDENRASALAKMISGDTITKGALEHAKELLKKAV